MSPSAQLSILLTLKDMASGKPASFGATPRTRGSILPTAALGWSADLAGHPLLVALGQEGRDEAQAGCGVREDQRNTGAALDLAIDAFQAVGCAQSDTLGVRQIEHRGTLSIEERRLSTGCRCLAHKSKKPAKLVAMRVFVGLWWWWSRDRNTTRIPNTMASRGA